MKKTSIFLAILCLCQALQAQQLYNMNLDTWSKQGRTWNPYPKDASEEQRVWATANGAMKVLGLNSTTPEYEHVAVSGPGKAAFCALCDIFGPCAVFFGVPRRKTGKNKA